MKVLMVTSECAGVAAVGGVAECVSGLAAALSERGHDVRLVVPAYGFLRRHRDMRLVQPRLVVRLGVGASTVTSVGAIDVPGPGAETRPVPVMVLGEHPHFASVQQPGEIYAWPNHEPWIAFSRAVVDWLDGESWRPDVIHCHDAHAALVPVYVQQHRARQATGFGAAAATVLTVHNLLDQGIGSPATLAYAGLPAELFHVDLFEYHGLVNCLKAGLLSADRVNTVSGTYAREICQSDEYGFGLQGVLCQLAAAGRLGGILNGIDERRWRMEGLRYDGVDAVPAVLKAKRQRRSALYRRWKWRGTDEPVIGFRGRWDHQKGVEVLCEAIPAMLDGAKVIVVTWGTPGATPALRQLWGELSRTAAGRPDRLLVNPPGLSGIDETAAHYAIADLLAVPSRYEPAGLVQMECQRFGALPVARQTGGLADTVSEIATPRFPSPNGFVFEGLGVGPLEAAVQRALEALRDPSRRNELVANALRQRNGWETRVPDYEALYVTALARRLRAGAQGG